MNKVFSNGFLQLECDVSAVSQCWFWGEKQKAAQRCALQAAVCFIHSTAEFRTSSVCTLNMKWKCILSALQFWKGSAYLHTIFRVKMLASTWNASSKSNYIRKVRSAEPVNYGELSSKWVFVTRPLFFTVKNKSMEHEFYHLWITHQLNNSLLFGPHKWKTLNVKSILLDCSFVGETPPLYSLQNLLTVSVFLVSSSSK